MRFQIFSNLGSIYYCIVCVITMDSFSIFPCAKNKKEHSYTLIMDSYCSYWANKHLWETYFCRYGFGIPSRMYFRFIPSVPRICSRSIVTSQDKTLPEDEGINTCRRLSWILQIKIVDIAKPQVTGMIYYYIARLLDKTSFWTKLKRSVQKYSFGKIFSLMPLILRIFNVRV